MEEIKVSITARGRHNPYIENSQIHIKKYLSKYIKAIKRTNIRIDYIFGTLPEWTPLYGGRFASNYEISYNEINWLEKKNIGIKIPLQCETFTENELLKTIPILQKYHNTNNAIVLANNALAEFIKAEFPLYQLEASAILDLRLKDLDSSIYNTIVLPIYRNDNFKFLKKIKDKNNVRLFLNGECSYNCPAKVCYSSISKMNKEPHKDIPLLCSAETIPRKSLIDSKMGKDFIFPLEKYIALGFSKFKMVSLNSELSQHQKIYGVK